MCGAFGVTRNAKGTFQKEFAPKEPRCTTFRNLRLIPDGPSGEDVGAGCLHNLPRTLRTATLRARGSSTVAEEPEAAGDGCGPSIA